MIAKLDFRSLLKNTAILGSSSIVNILVGLVATKFWALILGPGGLGFMGLLQNIVALAGLVAGMGISSGIIRQGSAALAREDFFEIFVLRRAAWLLFCVNASVFTLLLIVLQAPISQMMLGSAEKSGYVVLMVLPLVLSLASGIQTGFLNAYHRIGTLAKLSMINSIFGTCVGLACVWLWHESGIPAAIITSSALGWILSLYSVRKEIPSERAQVPWPQVFEQARGLFRFGVPYTASMLVGTGVQLALPALALHLLGIDSVGYYRAALSISVSYLGFLLAAMGQDYYPRISAASDRKQELVQLVNQQHRLVMLLAVPMILGVLALAPYIVPLLFSARFSPTVDILEWQLIGDLFKFSSWTMGFVILARSGSVTLFVTELTAGVVSLVSAFLGMLFFGLLGLGIAFLVSYIFHYCIVSYIVHREINLVWTQSNKRMMLAAIAAAFIIRTLPFVGLEDLRTPIALFFATATGVYSLSIIGREIGGWQNVPALLRGANK